MPCENGMRMRIDSEPDVISSSIEEDYGFINMNLENIGRDQRVQGGGKANDPVIVTWDTGTCMELATAWREVILEV